MGIAAPQSHGGHPQNGGPDRRPAVWGSTQPAGPLGLGGFEPAGPPVAVHYNQAGLAARVAWLLEQRYSSHAMGRIESHIAVHGTLAGSMIEPEDEAAAEEAFVEGLDAVPGDSDAWDRPDAFIDLESLLEPRRPVAAEPPAEGRSIPPGAALMPPELVDDLDDDLARFEAEHPVPAAPAASHGDPAARPDRHSPDARERVTRLLAAHDASR
jgi:hypothetical protein